MKKEYNIFSLAREYVKIYFKFLIEETDISSKEKADKLFAYSISQFWLGRGDGKGLSSQEKDWARQIIKRFKEIPDAPKAPYRFSTMDRKNMVKIAVGYLEISKTTDGKLKHFRSMEENSVGSV